VTFSTLSANSLWKQLGMQKKLESKVAKARRTTAEQVSISSTFYEPVFCTKVLAAFL